LAREAIKPAGDEATPITLKSKGKLRIFDAEENETIGGGESASVLIIENERNLSEGGMLYNERR
jgi:hypothetical protein